MTTLVTFAVCFQFVSWQWGSMVEAVMSWYYHDTGLRVICYTCHLLSEFHVMSQESFVSYCLLPAFRTLFCKHCWNKIWPTSAAVSLRVRFWDFGMQALAMDSDCSGRKRYFSARQVEKAHRMLPRKYTVEELCKRQRLLANSESWFGSFSFVNLKKRPLSLFVWCKLCGSSGSHAGSGGWCNLIDRLQLQHWLATLWTIRNGLLLVT